MHKSPVGHTAGAGALCAQPAVEPCCSISHYCANSEPIPSLDIPVKRQKKAMTVVMAAAGREKRSALGGWGRCRCCPGRCDHRRGFFLSGLGVGLFLAKQRVGVVLLGLVVGLLV